MGIESTKGLVKPVMQQVGGSKTNNDANERRGVAESSVKGFDAGSHKVLEAVNKPESSVPLVGWANDRSHRALEKCQGSSVQLKSALHEVAKHYTARLKTTFDQLYSKGLPPSNRGNKAIEKAFIDGAKAAARETKDSVLSDARASVFNVFDDLVHQLQALERRTPSKDPRQHKELILRDIRGLKLKTKPLEDMLTRAKHTVDDARQRFVLEQDRIARQR